MRKIIICLLSMIILICVIIIGYKMFLYHKDSKVYIEINELKPIAINEINDINADSPESDLINQKIQELIEINNDFKFWISIDNTKVDYPVVQGKNNEFYLKNNFLKEESISGAIFLDYRNDIYNDKNLIIYGHNMRNGTMFKELTKFKEKDFFYGENYIDIILDGVKEKYEVFSVYTLHSDDISLKNSFNCEDEYKEYLKIITEKSIYNKDINIETSDEIITLITCSYEYNDARTIVHARNIRNNQ